MHRIRHGIIGLCIMGLAACASGGGTDDTVTLTSGIVGDGNGQNFSSDWRVDARDLSVGDSASFAFNDNTYAELSFGDDTDAESAYLLAIYAVGDTTNQTFSFALGSDSDAALRTHEALAESSDDLENSPDATHDFHMMLRDDETEMADEEDSSPRYHSSLSLKTESNPAPVLGSSRDFNVLNSLTSTSSCETVTAEAVLVADHFVLYSDTDCPLGDSNIAIFEDYDEKFESLSQIIGEASDVDNNDRFFLLATCVVNSLGTKTGGFVTGYFYAGDLQKNKDFSCSNEAEIIYIDIPDKDSDYGSVAISNSFWEDNLASTVPFHEYQHMVSYNQHVFVHDSTSELSTVNEHLSHLIEDAAVGEVSMENPSRANRFLREPYANNPYAGNNLAQRGGGYLILRYLCEQADLNNLPAVANCDELLNALVATGDRGFTNLESATGLPWETLLGRFALTLAVSNLHLTEDPLYNFTGLDLYHTSFDDNRNTSFKGPTILDYPQDLYELTANSTLLLSLSGKDIATMGGVVELNGSTDLDPHAHLIRIK